MGKLENRLDTLEQAAKLLERQQQPSMSDQSLEEFRRKFEELASRPRPEKTQEEVILEFKAYAERKRIEFELRYVKSHVRGRNV